MKPDELYRRVYLEERCPECDSQVTELDKDTSSGRDVRLYHCTACQWSAFIDVGEAMWKTLSHLNDETQAT
jgi:hypothetical protein